MRATLLFWILLLAGCGGGSGAPKTPITTSFDPIIVTPTVPAEAVKDDAETMVATSDDDVIRFVEERAGVAVGRSARKALANHPPEKGHFWLSRLTTAGDPKVIFVLRRADDTRLVIVDQGAEGLVPPLSWMSLAMPIKGANAAELKAWQRELARRVATKGRATGIVVFPNGNAWAVLVGEESEKTGAEEVQLIARARFMRAGTFSADAWGPRLSVADDGRVGTAKMNGHEGISVRDMLLKVSAEPAAAPPPK